MYKKWIRYFISKQKVKTYFQVAYYKQNAENLRKYLGNETYQQFVKVDMFFDPNQLFGIKLVNKK